MERDPMPLVDRRSACRVGCKSGRPRSRPPEREVSAKRCLATHTKAKNKVLRSVKLDSARAKFRTQKVTFERSQKRLLELLKCHFFKRWIPSYNTSVGLYGVGMRGVDHTRGDNTAKCPALKFSWCDRQRKSDILKSAPNVGDEISMRASEFSKCHFSRASEGGILWNFACDPQLMA